MGTKTGPFFEWGNYFFTDNGLLFYEFLPLLLEPRRWTVRGILEVGFFQGQGTSFLLQYFLNSVLVTIDADESALNVFNSAQLGYLRERAGFVYGKQCDPATPQLAARSGVA